MTYGSLRSTRAARARARSLPRALGLWAALLAGCGASEQSAPHGAHSSAADGPRCEGKSGTLRGKQSATVTAAGVERSFVYYAPEALDPNEPAPVVIVAHGFTMSGEDMFDLTHYDALADTEGFVVLYPDGEPGSLGPWNVGEDPCASSLGPVPLASGDDQAFLDAMIAFVTGDRCVDRAHVFVTGFSMGGYFANETGCLRSDIAAIAPHSGGSHDLDACPVTRKPVLLFHGTSDVLIPTSCSVEARDRWAARNGCSDAVDRVDVLGGHCEYSTDCPADGQVVLCLFDGMDHGWAGGDGPFGFPDYESATELGYRFFRDYGWSSP
jgi:polyhydroxybutyrate depolymerase